MYELLQLQPPVRDATVRDVQANGKSRLNTFAAITDSLKAYTPELATDPAVRARRPGLVGRLQPLGIYDALGAASRVGVPRQRVHGGERPLSPVPPELRGAASDPARRSTSAIAAPGAAGAQDTPTASNPWQPAGVDCDPSQVLPGK
jgi:hypothetical protein